MLGGAQHRLHLFIVHLVVDDEVGLLALAVNRLGETPVGVARLDCADPVVRCFPEVFLRICP